MAMKKDTWNENALANPAMKSRDDSYSAVKLGAGEAFGIDAAMTNIEVGADNSLHVNTLNKNVPTNEKLESVAEGLQTQITQNATLIAELDADVVHKSTDANIVYGRRLNAEFVYGIKHSFDGDGSLTNVPTTKCIADSFLTPLTSSNKGVSVNDFNTPLTSSNKGATMKEIEEVLTSSLTFKGYISTTAPDSTNYGLIENNLWINSATLPTTYPVPASQIKVWNGTSWVNSTESYTPKAFESWSNLNDKEGYYWFGGVWKVLSTDLSTDNFVLNQTSGKWEIKDSGVKTNNIADGAITAPKLAPTLDKIIKKSWCSVSSLGAATESMTVIFSPTVTIYELDATEYSETINLTLEFPATTETDAYTFELHVACGATPPQIVWTDDIKWVGQKEPAFTENTTAILTFRKQGTTKIIGGIAGVY